MRVFTETGRKAVSWYVGDLGRWDTSRITNMEAAFYGVAPALTIDLTGWNVDQVTRHESFTDSRKILVPNWVL